MSKLATQTSVLATGFGPFLSHNYNPSWEVAQGFARALGAGFNARAERLDVSFEVARRFAEGIYFGGQPDAQTPDFDPPEWLVHFGLAASSAGLRFEGFGYNRRGQTSDASGAGARKCLDGQLLSDAAASYQTGVDVARMTEIFEQVGAPKICGLQACVSDDPGDYVCNAIYYHSLRAAERVRANGAQAQVLFVHVPALDPARAREVGEAVAASFRGYLDL